MNKTFALLAILGLLLGLCACGAEPTVPATTTAAPVPTTTAEAGCVHQYADADCVTPKTCTLCGHTRGKALGHDYAEGVCTRCGAEDADYVPLFSSLWVAVASSGDGSAIEEVTLLFEPDGASCSLFSVVYHRLSDVPEEQRTAEMLNEENWYDYSGEVYYRTGASSLPALTCSISGDIITCSRISDDTLLGTLILERTAGNMLSVTYCDGELGAQFLTVGDVFDGNA